MNDYKKLYEEMVDKYEQLLEDLPQSKYSKASTPAMVVAKEVDNNIYIKEMVKDDIKEMLEESDTYEDFVFEINEYFSGENNNEK